MWYTGQAREYSFIGYAESDDGISFSRLPEPVMIPERPHEGEAVMNPCVLFEDGITGWQKYDGNPIVSPDRDSWDGDACYKPSILFDEKNNRWLLWYNGRRAHEEFIGVATLEGRKIFK